MLSGKRKRSPSPEPSDIGKHVSSLLHWRKNVGYKHYPSEDLQDPFLYLVFYFKNFAYFNHHHLINNITRIRIPHSLLPQHPKLALIINDTTIDNEELRIMHMAHEKIQSLNIPISQILLSNLQAEKSSLSPCRLSLFYEFNMIFADKSMIPLFNDTFRDLAPFIDWLDLKNNGDWKGQIESACFSTMLYLIEGNRYEMKVGRISTNTEEIVGNIKVAYKCVVDLLPDRWGNIGSIQLKLLESDPIQIY